MPSAVGLVRVGPGRALALDEPKAVFDVLGNLPGRGLDFALDALAGVHASALVNGVCDECSLLWRSEPACDLNCEGHRVV